MPSPDKIEPVDFTMTVLEIRTVMTVLQTLVDRKLLPGKQMWIIKEVLRKMNLVHFGEYN